MLHTVKEREFARLLREKERFVEEHYGDAALAFEVLYAKWAPILPPIQITILGFLVSRTLLCGRSAARIPVAELESGVSASRNTVRDHLNILILLDLVHVFRTVSDEKETEKTARMFEIDCKKLHEGSEIGQKAPSKLFGKGLVRTQNLPKKEAERGGQNLTPRGSKIDPLNIYINRNYVPHDLKQESNDSSARSSRIGGSREIEMLPTPKKPRSSAPAKNESAADIIARVSATHAAKREARTARAQTSTPYTLTKAELQALIDTQQRLNAPGTLRMIVTTKEFGLLRKRLRESSPEDFGDFIGWVFRYWSTISNQHRKAIQRSAERSERGEKGIPPSPDFASLAYRYPYFLKAYGNFQADRAREKAEEVEGATERKLRATIDRQSRAIEALNSQIKRVNRRTTQPTRLSQPAPQPRHDALDLGADELPEWSAPARKGMKNG